VNFIASEPALSSGSKLGVRIWSVIRSGMFVFSVLPSIRPLRSLGRLEATSMPEYSWIEEAKNIGVDSFWYKETNKESILEIMLKTMHGEHIYPQDTFVVKFGNITNHDLTKRELQILKEMLAGDSNAEIAKRLYISSGTVKRHIENMLLKTGFHTRTELAAEAGRLGIVIKNSGI
jgi:two-component system vancomycin resistance associated response regulator VraR